MIYAKIIADSVTDWGKRITTLELSYPRFIHGEVMTHRMFSRNAMSSRAIPVSRMLEQVRTDPVIPLYWGANQPGMQAKAEVPYSAMLNAIDVWKLAAHDACNRAQQLTGLGLHKQVVNRLLEPFQWMRTIVTATEWDNFFALRDHPDAEPHFQQLAKEIRRSMDDSVPTPRPSGLNLKDRSAWHLPYVRQVERDQFDFLRLIKASAARCARVSYLSHDGETPSMESDVTLYDRLVGSVPMHASPVEHQAFAVHAGQPSSGNFIGWLQYRKLLEKQDA